MPDALMGESSKFLNTVKGAKTAEKEKTSVK
jgi:hypothetical protein